VRKAKGQELQTEIQQRLNATNLMATHLVQPQPLR
jgi:hypothetical protein